MSILTNADSVYYIDPIADPTIPNPSKAVVFGTRRDHESPRRGEVTGIKNLEYASARLWIVDEGGNHIHGAILNSPETAGMIVGIHEDGTWVVGRRQVNDVETHTLIADPVRSTGLVPDGGGAPINDLAATPMWAKAASWAEELMPLPTDPDSVAGAKLALARELWDQRYKASILLGEALYRSWHEDMQDMREDGWGDVLPAPVMGAFVAGTITLGRQETVDDDSALTPAQRAAVASIRAKSMGGTERLARRVMVPVQFPMRTAATTEEEFTAINREAVLRAARNHFDDYGVDLSTDYTIRPVLRHAIPAN